MTSSDGSGGYPVRRPSSPPPMAVDVDLSFDVDALHALRSTLAAHASEHLVPEEQIEHLLIVATELATNAIRHGGGTGRLRVWHHDTALYCQVSDRGPGLADPTAGTSRPSPTDPDAHRGLWICRSLADELTIQANPGGAGVTITATLRP